MPAKPKRGTLPSLDGDGLDKRNTFVKRRFHFRTIFRTGAAHLRRPETRAITTLARSRTFPHTRTQLPLNVRRDPYIYMLKKDTKQKNTTHIRGVEYLCARMGASVRVCGNVRKSGNPHHSCICALFPMCGRSADRVRKRFFDCTSAREMLSHARKALRTPFPLSQSG